LALAQELIKINGRDVTGAAATYNPTYSVANVLAFIRDAYTPTKSQLKGTASDGGDIGAVPVKPSGYAFWFGM
jgi:hypothetical protein